MGDEVRLRFWREKYRQAKRAHAEEYEKMRPGGPGASLIRLERAVNKMERAAREIRKLERDSDA